MKRLGISTFGLWCLLFTAAAWSQVYTSENPSTDGSYTITWDQQPGNVTNFQVYETKDGGSSSVVYTGIFPRSKSFTNKSNGSYEYEVIADWCDFVCIPMSIGTVTVTVNALPAPSTPGVISAPSTASTGSYAVSWGASSGTVTSYQLQQRANGGSWSTVYTGTSRSRSYSKTQNNYYDYRVRACNQSVCSNYTSNKRVTVPAASITLNGPGSIARTDSTFTVSWGSVMTSSCSANEGGISGTGGSASLRLPNGWSYSQMPNGYYWTKTITVTC